MADEKKTFTPMTTEEKIEFGKQFSAERKSSYYTGQRNAYSHMANAARQKSNFVNDNLKKNEAAKPKAKPNKPKK